MGKELATYDLYKYPTAISDKKLNKVYYQLDHFWRVIRQLYKIPFLSKKMSSHGWQNKRFGKFVY